MTLPRRVLPGKVVAITRSCAKRAFHLRPDGTVNLVILYCLAVAADRYGVEVIGINAMSNHLHLVVHDVKGLLPDFMAWFDRHVAMCLKEHFGIDENLWSVGSYDVVELTTEDAILEKTVYCLANPVAAGLVDRSKKWPGVVSRPDACRRPPRRIARPKVYFSPKGRLPKTATLRFHRPPIARLTDDAWSEMLAQGLHLREREIAAEMAMDGRRFKGAKAVRRQSPTTRPRTQRGGGINPRVAGRNKATRIRSLQALRAFHEAYRAALRRLREGAADVCFPAGTWRLRVHYAVRCHPIPA